MIRTCGLFGGGDHVGSHDVAIMAWTISGRGTNRDALPIPDDRFGVKGLTGAADRLGGLASRASVCMGVRRPATP
jgi:hypothetical protein